LKKLALKKSVKRHTLSFVVNHAEIERRRLALDLNMQECADLAGFPNRQRWYDVESGRRVDPAASTLAAVARALGCRMEDLMKETTGK
jgi:transcriptional regulator with XRE-family HTH domain